MHLDVGTIAPYSGVVRFLAGTLALAILAFACSSQHPLLVGSTASTVVSTTDFAAPLIPAAELARKSDNESNRHASEIPMYAEASEDDLDEDADQNELLLALPRVESTHPRVIGVDVVWDRSVQRVHFEQAPSDLNRPPNA